MNGLVVVIAVVALVVVGVIWWWVVQPHGDAALAPRDTPLPLFTTRSPGRGVRIARPNLSRAGVVAGKSEAPAVAAAPAPAPVAVAESARAPAPGVAAMGAMAAVPLEVPVAPPPRPSYPADLPPPSDQQVAPAAVAETQEIRPSPGSRAPTPSGRNGRAPTAPPAVTPSRTFETVAVSEAERQEDHRAVRRGDGNATEERWAPPAAPSPSGTIQFLPGRLEVLYGGRAMAGQEVRFVRPDRPGDRAVVTFGRAEGAPYRHVQLKVPTVSRLHARMSLEPGSSTWKLENLSTTNPVAVNGVDLPHGSPPVGLSDGDRVEMGEIVFTFRAR